MTTIAFLLNGVREGNPLVRLAVQFSPNPLQGLVAIKIAAILLGIYCWRAGRERLLNRVNMLFAIIVAWNLVALILASASIKGS